jgi:hypothetical protein
VPALKPRWGTGLAESLVTLVLAGIVMAAASRGLSQHLRIRHERDDQARADDIVRVVRDVLRSELGHADPAAIRLLGDTAVEVASSRVVTVACDQVASRLAFPTSAAWWSAPRAGDSLALLDTLTGAEWRTAVLTTGTLRASARCPSGGTRLTLAAMPPASAPALLLPGRVWHTVRYLTYRSGDGSWWLGERSCAPVCGSAQPIAGPLLPPGGAGFRLALVLAWNGRPVALDVWVRAVVGTRSSAMSARLPLAAIP